jgi:hypothetical protein
MDSINNRKIFIPDFTSRLALQYHVPLNVRHNISKQYFDPANTISQSVYSLGNASIGIYGAETFPIKLISPMPMILAPPISEIPEHFA